MGRLTGWRDRLISALSAPPTSAPQAAAAAPPGPGSSSPTSSSGPPTDPVDKLDAIARWVAGAFVLFSSVLSFIGIRDGQLDRILRSEPRAALFVFALIGLAVIGGVVAPAVGPEKRIPLWVVVSALGLPMVLSAPFLPNLGGGPGIAAEAAAMVLVVGTLVVGCLAFLLSGRATSLKASTIALALLLFTIGMYGAVKLGVAGKSAKDRPGVTAEFAVRDTKPVVAVGVKASGLRTDEHLAGTVWGFGSRSTNRELDAFPCGDSCLLLYAFRIGADGDGAIDTSFDVPLTPGDFSRVSVIARVCEGEEADHPQGQADVLRAEREDLNKCRPTEGKSAYLDLRVPASPDRPRLIANVKPGPADRMQVDVTPTMDGVGGDGFVAVRIFTAGDLGEYQQMAAFDVAPAPSGEASTPATSVILPTDARRICVTATLVRPGQAVPPSGCEAGAFTAVSQQNVPTLTTTVAATGLVESTLPSTI